MRQKFFYLAISLLVGTLVWLSFSSGLFTGLENFFEDLLFSQKPVDKRIVIAAIDDESIRRIGQWPWPRELFSQALFKLNQNPPLSLGLDVIFSEPSRLGKKDDQALADALNQIAYPIVFPVEASPLLLDEQTPQAVNFLKPLPIFLAPEQTSLGLVNLIADPDSLVRKFPLLVREKGKPNQYRAFSYQVLKKSGLNIPQEENLSQINRIVYSVPAGAVRRIPFWRILEDEVLEELENKIVFMGATAPDLQDTKPAPLGRGKEMSGAEIHAQISNMLLKGLRLAPLANKITLAWILLAALIPGLFFIFLKRNLIALLAGLFLGAGYLTAIVILFQKGTAANIIHINLSWLGSLSSLFGFRFFVIDKEKRQLKNLFSKYVSKEVLAEILKKPEKIALGGEEKEITVFFSDIRGFTALSEKTKPGELVSILNQYFSFASERILANAGVLDKYIGDAIMAFWGAPIEDENQADNALKAGLEIAEGLAQFNQEIKEKGRGEINIGIGLYTGPAIVGNIGSEARFDYTAIGDTVNAASRLEGLTKKYQTKIILAESTKNKLKKSYQLKPLGSVLVKGKTQPINIYTLI